MMKSLPIRKVVIEEEKDHCFKVTAKLGIYEVPGTFSCCVGHSMSIRLQKFKITKGIEFQLDMFMRILMSYGYY